MKTYSRTALNHRFLGACLLLLAIVAATPARAMAWSNGPYDGNGFSTHDWILEEALRLAGSGGTWAVKTTALKASDDPDNTGPLGTSKLLHTYHQTGSARGAPHMVATEYHSAVLALRRGDRTSASKHLGRLSHYYGDICMPYHTTSAGSAKRNDMHIHYEADVSRHQRSHGAVRSWITVRPRAQMTDVRASAISAALYARTEYSALDASYRATRSVTRGDSGRITRAVLSRAVNDLADLIRTVRSGSAEATLPPAFITRSIASPPDLVQVVGNLPSGSGVATVPTIPPAPQITYNYARQNQKLGAFVRLVDANGKPLPGVGVRIVWQLASGTKSVLVFSEDDGWAHNYTTIDTSPLGRRITVTASASAGGRTIKSTSFFVATRVPESGAEGFHLEVPRQMDDTVTATAVLRDSSGSGIAGVPVLFGTTMGNTVAIVFTDSQGLAHLRMRAERNRNGDSEQLSAQAQAGGYNRTARSYFTF